MTELEKTLLLHILNNGQPQNVSRETLPVAQQAPSQPAQAPQQQVDNTLTTLMLQYILQQNLSNTSQQAPAQPAQAPQQQPATIAAPSSGFMVQNTVSPVAQSSTEQALERLIMMNIAASNNKKPETTDDIIGNFIAPPTQLPEFGSEPNGVKLDGK